MRPYDVFTFNLNPQDGDTLHERSIYTIYYKDSQIVEFDEPVFADSIVVYSYDRSVNPPTLQRWGEDEWSYDTTNDVDETTTGFAKHYAEASSSSTGFNRILIKRITLNRQYMSGLNTRELKITYKAFYRAKYKPESVLYNSDVDALDAAIGPDYDPAMMREVLRYLDQLSSILKSLKDDTSRTLSTHPLPEDLTGTLDENHILNEEHAVNVVNGFSVIRPVYGAFYRHDLQVVYNNRLLYEGADYDIVGLDQGRTRVSFPSSGVYHYIRVHEDIVAGTDANTMPLEISYHAFGGEMTYDLYKDFYNYVLGWITNMKIEGVLTIQNFQTTQLWQKIIDRFSNVERIAGIFPNTSFEYSHVYNKHQWVTIASYSTPTWSDINVLRTQSISTFRIRITNQNNQDFDGRFCLRFDSKQAQSLELTPLSVSEPSFAGLHNDPYFTYRIYPKFRVVWFESNNSGKKGYYLQMSISSSQGNSRTAVVSIYDETPLADAVWKLTASPMLEEGAAHLYGDNTNTTGVSGILPTFLDNQDVTLPNGMVWEYNSDKVSNTVVLTKAPIVSAVFYGSYPQDNEPNDIVKLKIATVDAETYQTGYGEQSNANQLVVPGNGVVMPTTIYGTFVSQSTCRAIGVLMYDWFTQQRMYFECPVDGTPIVYYSDDLCSLSAELIAPVNAGGTYSIRLKSHTGTNSLINDRFMICRLDVLHEGTTGRMTAVSNLPTYELKTDSHPEIPLAMYRSNIVRDYARL